MVLKTKHVIENYNTSDLKNKGVTTKKEIIIRKKTNELFVEQKLEKSKKHKTEKETKIEGMKIAKVKENLGKESSTI